MTYNFTFTHPTFLLPFEIVNSITPLASTMILVIIPFFIMLMVLIRYGYGVAFTTASFLTMLLSILFVSTGLVPTYIFTIFLALSIIGFIITSLRDNSMLGL